MNAWVFMSSPISVCLGAGPSVSVSSGHSRKNDHPTSPHPAAGVLTKATDRTRLTYSLASKNSSPSSTLDLLGHKPGEDTDPFVANKSQLHKRPMVAKDQEGSFQGNSIPGNASTPSSHPHCLLFSSYLCGGLSHLPTIARQLLREVQLPLQPMSASDPRKAALAC